jgi:hypothetical protein
MHSVWTLTIAALAALLLLGPPALRAQNGPYDPVEPGQEDRLIATFDARQLNAREFRFEWAFEEDDSDEVIICQIDFDGDDLVEATIENCNVDRQIRHRYDEAGPHNVILTARSRDGGSDVARLRVTARQ